MILPDCVPRDKHDTAAIERAKEIGFPALNPVLPVLLGWLKDMNWPVAPHVAELLSGAGLEIVPHIGAVLRSDDSVWKIWVLTELCPRIAPEVVAALDIELEELVKQPSKADRSEGADLAARKLLRLA